MRDRFVCWACNFLIRRVATDWYRQRLEVILDMGVNGYVDALYEAADDAHIE